MPGYAATITRMEVMSDGSGAPALVSFGPYRFALDYLAEVKCNLLAPVSGSRRASRVAAQYARTAYEQALDERTDDGWLEANRAMYRS
jgi:hypothetical protein